MESILFSLNSVMPLFLMGIAGYLLVQRGVVNENFVDQASNLLQAADPVQSVPGGV